MLRLSQSRPVSLLYNELLERDYDHCTHTNILYTKHIAPWPTKWKWKRRIVKEISIHIYTRLFHTHSRPIPALWSGVLCAHNVRMNSTAPIHCISHPQYNNNNGQKRLCYFMPKTKYYLSRFSRNAHDYSYGMSIFQLQVASTIY